LCSRADEEDEYDELPHGVGDDDDDDDDNGNNDDNVDDGRERLFRVFDGDPPPSTPLPPRLCRFVIVIVYVVFFLSSISNYGYNYLYSSCIIRKKG
jgi:hypothetical protein